MDLLNPDALTTEMNNFSQTFGGRIDKLKIRLDGICKNCLMV
ncbi:MAG: hypothetical protein ABIJ31_12165 [Pseudomonadota bacterium]